MRSRASGRAWRPRASSASPRPPPHRDDARGTHPSRRQLPGAIGAIESGARRRRHGRRAARGARGAGRGARRARMAWYVDMVYGVWCMANRGEGREDALECHRRPLALHGDGVGGLQRRVRPEGHLAVEHLPQQHAVGVDVALVVVLLVTDDLVRLRVRVRARVSGRTAGDGRPRVPCSGRCRSRPCAQGRSPSRCQSRPA